MPKNTSQDAVSKAVARAVDIYYQSSPGGVEVELVGRVFQEYLNYFRRLVWSSATTKDLLLSVERAIGPLPVWVTKDLTNTLP
ncbi:MAG: hypothetical protein K6U74_11860 [Firmicutes bacterium]|nr:hypothetical protein [Bacillota bacterium]